MKIHYSEEEILRMGEEKYNHGEAQFEIVSGKTALLVIDMQVAFAEAHQTHLWVPEATRQIPRIATLIAHCRGKEIPVIYTVFSRTNHFLDRPKSGAGMPNRFPEIDSSQYENFLEGKVVEPLKPEPGDIVIHKPSYGAFYDTCLETVLKNMQRDTVIVCGTMTNYCCSTTARHAYERGFHVIFGSDINATNSDELQQAELKTMRAGFAKVMDHEEIITALK
ncbi:MAG: cysteine hydrolase [bacterium]|nr:cysteine hydrolase [bacterium]